MRRLKFEREQINAELAEAEELLASARQEMTRKQETISMVDRRVRDLDMLLRPFQAAASGIVASLTYMWIGTFIRPLAGITVACAMACSVVTVWSIMLFLHIA